MDGSEKRGLKRPVNEAGFHPAPGPPSARLRPGSSPEACADQHKNVVSTPPFCSKQPPVPDLRWMSVDLSLPEDIPSTVVDSNCTKAPIDSNTEVNNKNYCGSTSQTGGNVPQDCCGLQSGLNMQPRCDFNESEEEAEKEEEGEKMQEGWLLQKGLVPGGPSIPDLIPSFGGHVALDVWVGKERGTLQGHNCRTNLLQLSEQTLQCEPARKIVQESGLPHLRDAMFSSNNMSLLSAFLERWQPDTNTFHMPFGEMTITLHDVWEILQVPIHGKAITALEEEAIGGCPPLGEIQDALACMLGLKDQFELVKKRFYNENGLTFDSVMDRIILKKKKKSVGYKFYYEQQAAAYLLYLLGASLFVGKKVNYLNPTIYWLLRNINDVRNYAWGVGTLAWLYRQLGIASRGGSLELSGCLTLLECWIYEYFPKLRPPMADGYKPSEARAFKWKKSDKCVKENDLLYKYRTQLDNLTDKDVDWVPYGFRPWEELQHRSALSGTCNFFDIIEPYMPMRVLRQFGLVQHIPSAPISPLTMERPQRGTSYVAKYLSSIPEIWNTPWYETIDSIHNARTCSSSGASPQGKTVAEYMSWYIQRTHPRISNTDVEKMRQKKHSVYERVLDILCPWFPTCRRYGYGYHHQSNEELKFMFAQFDEAFKLVESVMSTEEQNKARLMSAHRVKYGGFKKMPQKTIN